MDVTLRTPAAQSGATQPVADPPRPASLAPAAPTSAVQPDALAASEARPRSAPASNPALVAPGVCRATTREGAALRGTPANVADVVAAARRNGVDVTPQVFAAARDVLVPTYNDDYRACDVPMYCYDFSMKMRDDLRARFSGATAEVVELRADDPSNGVNHYVVRANFGQGPIILDATADQFELLADRPRIGPQLRSEADYMKFIQARGYGRPQVVD